MSVSDIILQLKATSSRNEKEAILEENKENAQLKHVFELVLNPFCNFYLTKIPSIPHDYDMSLINQELEVTEELIIGFLYQEAFGSINRKEFKEGVMILN